MSKKRSEQTGKGGWKEIMEEHSHSKLGAGDISQGEWKGTHTHTNNEGGHETESQC